MFSANHIQEYWVSIIRLGDEQAYYALYRHYYHYLRLIGVRKGFASESTKDAINEVFLHVWENRGKLSHIHSPHNYLITVFFRKMLKDEDKKGLVRNFSDEDMEVEEQTPDFSFFEHKVRAQQDARKSMIINHQLLQLPERQREMIYQKFFLGRSYQEIAADMQVSVNTVYNTIYTAIDKLRNLLGNNNILLSILPFFALLKIFS